jgi:hypothetical protein
MERPICPVDKLPCQKLECQNGFCAPTGNVNSFENLEASKKEADATKTLKALGFEGDNKKSTFDMEDLKESKSKKLTAQMEIAPSVGVSRVANMMATIQLQEPAAFEVLAEIISHIHGTYSDKYQSDVTDWLDTKALLLSKNGKYASIHSASKYIQRYSTTGFEKSGQLVDIYKAVHYLVFLIQRHKKFE